MLPVPNLCSSHSVTTCEVVETCYWYSKECNEEGEKEDKGGGVGEEIDLQGMVLRGCRAHELELSSAVLLRGTSNLSEREAVHQGLRLFDRENRRGGGGNSHSRMARG